MENTAFIEELKALTQNENTLTVSREVNELKSRFDDSILEAERKEQVAQLEAQEKGETYEPKIFKDDKDAFYEVFNEYKERKKLEIASKNASEAENLKKKRALIARLKDLIEKEENIGTAYNTYKEIHESWKTIGDIPRDNRDGIQKEYSKLLEDFFYNMKIYRELKDHDLKRNYQLKLDLITQLEALKSVTSLKEIETSLKSLQNDWEGIGPVINEEWENLKAKYWENVRAIYEKVNAYYDERRTNLIENLTKKKALLAEAKEVIETSMANDTVKLWDASTEKLLALQEKWKVIGFGPRKENEEIWNEFRALCDDFFARKKTFFGTIQEKFGKIAEAKQQLIAQAHAVKESTEWKMAADKLVLLQKQWKATGHAGQKLEQKLWTEFRSACDSFFNNRQKHFDQQDTLLEGNLLAKRALIQQIESHTLATDKKQALTELRDFTAAFNAAGMVPMKEKDTVYNAYKKAIDALYGKLKLEGEEKESILYQSRIETLTASPDAARLFSKEKAEIRHQIELLKSDILQYENNLGFFAKSKGADAMRKEVEDKVNASKNKIEALKRKLKMIPNE